MDALCALVAAETAQAEMGAAEVLREKGATASVVAAADGSAADATSAVVSKAAAADEVFQTAHVSSASFEPSGGLGALFGFFGLNGTGGKSGNSNEESGCDVGESSNGGENGHGGGGFDESLVEVANREVYSLVMQLVTLRVRLTNIITQREAAVNVLETAGKDVEGQCKASEGVKASAPAAAAVAAEGQPEGPQPESHSTPLGRSLAEVEVSSESSALARVKQQLGELRAARRAAVAASLAVQAAPRRDRHAQADSDEGQEAADSDEGDDAVVAAARAEFASLLSNTLRVTSAFQHEVDRPTHRQTTEHTRAKGTGAEVTCGRVLSRVYPCMYVGAPLFSSSFLSFSLSLSVLFSLTLVHTRAPILCAVSVRIFPVRASAGPSAFGRRRRRRRPALRGSAQRHGWASRRAASRRQAG
jgi:hypothetical protein